MHFYICQVAASWLDIDDNVSWWVTVYLDSCLSPCSLLQTGSPCTWLWEVPARWWCPGMTSPWRQKRHHWLVPTGQERTGIQMVMFFVSHSEDEINSEICPVGQRAERGQGAARAGEGEREREGSGRVSDTDVMSWALSLGSLWSCLRLQDRKDARVLCGLSDMLIMSWVVHTSRPINATRMFKAL